MLGFFSYFTILLLFVFWVSGSASKLMKIIYFDYILLGLVSYKIDFMEGLEGDRLITGYFRFGALGCY